MFTTGSAGIVPWQNAPLSLRPDEFPGERPSAARKNGQPSLGFGFVRAQRLTRATAPMEVGFGTYMVRLSPAAIRRGANASGRKEAYFTSGGIEPQSTNARFVSTWKFD